MQPTSHANALPWRRTAWYLAGALLAGAATAALVAVNLARGEVVIDPGDGGVDLPPSNVCQNRCPAPSTDEIFLKVDGIPGESAHVHHRDEIAARSWSLGAEQKGGGPRGGKADFKDLTVVKTVDKATPKLMEALATGKHIREVELKVHRGGGAGNDYLKVKITDVVVSSIQMGGSNGEVPTETVTFSYGKIEFMYTPQDAEGGPGETESFGWDLKRNVRS